MRRRTLLATLGSGAALAGCIGSPPASEDDTADPTTRPCRDRDGTDLADEPYPSPVTRDAVERYAIAFEVARAKADARASGWTVNGVDWAEALRTVEVDGGYAVHVEVSLDAQKPLGGTTTAEGPLYGSIPSKAWYRVTERRAQRSPDASELPENGWTTVDCP